MGIDAFQEINFWKDAECLLKSCNFAIINREGIAYSDMLEIITKNLTQKFRDMQFRVGEKESESGLMSIKVMGSPYLIVPLETKPVNVSSTRIRKRLKRGKSAKELMPEKVNNYIEKNKLYSYHKAE